MTISVFDVQSLSLAVHAYLKQLVTFYLRAATELPELDNIFVQAISEDLRKRLVRHLDHPPSTTIDANLQSFNDIIELAIQEEAELETVTNCTMLVGRTLDTARERGR
jgi:hypothetical protein